MTGNPVAAGDERVDIVDGHDRVVATVSRRQMRSRRLRHRAVYVVVTSSAGRLLVHRRSEGKDLWPGRWDIAVGGVVAAGESYDDAARRELAEEVGVDDVAPVATGAGSYRDDDVDLLARTYRVVHDGPFHFADGEVAEVRWVDAAALRALIGTESFVPDSLALFPIEERFPFPPPVDPQGR